MGRTAGVLVGFIIYALMGIFPYLGSVLMAPPTGVAFLMASWALGLVAVTWLAHKRSLWVLSAPLLAALYWAIVMTIGERAFGWTA